MTSIVLECFWVFEAFIPVPYQLSKVTSRLYIAFLELCWMNERCVCMRSYMHWMDGWMIQLHLNNLVEVVDANSIVKLPSQSQVI